MSENIIWIVLLLAALAALLLAYRFSDKAKPEEIRRRLSSLTAFEVQTRFLTPEVLAASFAFGKGELDTGSRCINTLMEPCLLYAYVDQSWVNE
ncbi:hypothetical protein AAIA72_10850 [Hahella sp. SMD15-11]|uniref:Uncharacterized protein n=1 Tax=Thermohahella caldifontis TaxID=3142973 RepID=A0AB39USU2_9GAMM